MKAIKRALKESIKALHNMIKRSSYGLITTASFLLPYFAIWIVIIAYKQRGYFAIGGEHLVILSAQLTIFFLKKLVNNSGQGEEVPIPTKRITIPDEDEGRYYEVERDRLSELITFTGQVEDYLERVGKL